LPDYGQLFPNPVKEGLPTIQELAGSAERRNAWSVAEGVRGVPPTLQIVVGWRLLRYYRSLRKAGCGTQL